MRYKFDILSLDKSFAFNPSNLKAFDTDPDLSFDFIKKDVE
jgi:hypothetical protein